MIERFFSILAEMFSYMFLVRAFTVGALVSLCAALLGVNLVLKRYSMIGDGLSHVGFGALALATAMNAAPLLVSIPVVLCAAVVLLRLGEKTLIKGDAAIALLSTGSLALGVVIISQTTGMNTDVCNYLFGSILAMNKTDVYLSIGLSAVVFVLFILFYHKLFAVTFDEQFAEATGVPAGAYNMLTAVLTAITIVLGMRMMGAMLISALIIFPALTSMRVFKTFKSVTVCSVCVSLVCFFAGIVISYVYAIPTGASVVLINMAVFFLFWIIKLLKREGFFGKPVTAAALFTLLLTFTLLVPGCSGGKSAGSDGENNPAQNTAAKDEAAETAKVIEIKEKMFLAQVNDVYLNAEDYIGKTLKLEGLFKNADYGDSFRYFVIRYGPGCCGFDGNAGFEVLWDTEKKQYPKEDDWVEASGVLQRYEEDGFPYLYLALHSLNVLEKRGAEVLSQ